MISTLPYQLPASTDQNALPADEESQETGVVSEGMPPNKIVGNRQRTPASRLCVHIHDRNDRTIRRKYDYFDLKLLQVVEKVVSLGFVG